MKSEVLDIPGPIYVKAKPEGNSIKVDTLSMYYRQMGLTVLTESCNRLATNLQRGRAGSPGRTTEGAGWLIGRS